METTTRDYGLEIDGMPNLTVEGLSVSHPFPSKATLPHSSQRLMEDLAPWLLAFTVLTAPITYSPQLPEFCRSHSSSLSRAVESRRGQRISLREARQIALQTLADTERRLKEERAAEARFLLGPWEDENSSA